MSDKYTEARTPNGAIGDWGYLDYDEAIKELRQHYENQHVEAHLVLADIDAGRVRVFHQLGPYAARNRREVTP